MFCVLALILSATLTGVIWFVQIVHYPLFYLVPVDSFKQYEKKHQQLTSYVVLPLMITELLVSIHLFSDDPYSLCNILQILLLAIIWFSTFCIQMHIHKRLAKAKDTCLIQRLVKTNWIRTVSWTGRCLLFAGAIIL